MDFSAKLLKWYDENKRELPWRGSRDPYTIWLSEIILQQTRVVQGLPYFLRFKEAFPRVESLASAEEETVLKLWQGLGYYSRARNLHHTARKVAFEMDGRFPDTYEGLLALKGIGPYTAAAIASICFRAPAPVVDGNVYRVLARHFGIDLPVNTPAGQRCFREQAERLIDPARPGDYNQAIMEFGALQCVPGKPDCGKCPLNPSCTAFTANQVGDLPKKQPKPRPRKRYFHYIMPVDPAFRTYLRQRDQRGIWQGLYEFPLLERKAPPDLSELSQTLALATGMPPPEIVKKVRVNPRPIVHKLSHQHLHTTFWIVYVDALPKASTPIAEMGKFPVPVLISEFMDTVKNSYF